MNFSLNLLIIVLFFTYIGCQQKLTESFESSSESELILEILKTVKNTTGKYTDLKKKLKETTLISDYTKNKIDFKMFSDFTIKLFDDNLTKDYIQQKLN